MTTGRPGREPFDAIEVGIRRLRLVGLGILALALLLPGGYRPSPVGFGILAALAGLVLVANLTGDHLDRGRGAPDRLVALQLGIDVTATAGTLIVLDPEPGAGAWLVIALPVVEGAIRYGLIGALAVWLTTTLPVLAWTIAGWSPGDGVAAMTESGGVVVIGLAIGLPAGLAADRLADQWRVSDQDRHDLDDRADLLAVVAAAVERLADADAARASQILVEATARLGFPGAELAIVDMTTGHHRLVASQPTGYASGALIGPELAELAKAEPGTTRLGRGAQPMALLALGRTTMTVLAAGALGGGALDGGALDGEGLDQGLTAGGTEAGDAGARGHDAFAALSRYGAAAMATIGQRHALSRAGRDMEQRRGQDPLTELLNRAGFELAVASILDRLVPGAEIRVIAVDLDGFNPIVAEAGWRAGDAVLREVGARVARTCPGGAALARLDVDRFAIATDDPAVPDLASHLVDLLARPITTDVGTFTIRASIGQVITPDPSTPPLVAIEEAQRRSAAARPRSIAEAGRR